MEINQEWVVYGIIAFLIVALYTEIMRPAITFLAAVVLLVVFGVISAEEALHGFANEQLAVIVLLLILANIFSKTRVITTLFKGIFRDSDRPRGFLMKMMSTVGISSAFLNNTPLVAMMMPYVYTWSKKKKLSPSRFLIPLSYASILGGCVTLIGTSTNLIANGLASDIVHEMSGGEQTFSLGIFDFAYVGIPMLVIGFLYLLLFGHRLLPDKQSALEQLLGKDREYFLETHVKQNSSLIGKTVEDGGLRNLKGLFLVEIMRDGNIISPVAPTERLEYDDVLFFAGDLESITELTSPGMGLSLPKSCNIPVTEKTDVVEVVVAHNSRLVGKKVQDSDFRGRYDGAILAIHRNGEKLWGKIGDIALKAGDVLLVLAGKDFDKRTANSPAFYLISKAREIHAMATWKATILVVGLIGAVALAALGWVSLFISLSILLLLTLLLKMVSPVEIRNGVDFNLIIIIAMGLAFGKAMLNSGAADTLANSIAGVSNTFGPIGLLAGIFLVTNLLSAFMTSKAAVAIVMPIAISLAGSMHLPLTPFVLTVAFGGAANFMTPIGYQTNLMVYGPGGYSFKDFLKIGLPLTLIYLVVCVVILSYIYWNGSAGS